MPQTVFGYPVEVPASFDERSIYTFVLGTGPAGGFESNVVVVREPARGRDLGAYVAEQRKKLAAEMPGATFMREAKAKAGALAAHEYQYRLVPDRPLPGLVQLHTAVLRDGQVYDFCVTATNAEFEQGKKAVKALLDSWAKGASA